jgi:hypothetical protein
MMHNIGPRGRCISVSEWLSKYKLVFTYIEKQKKRRYSSMNDYFVLTRVRRAEAYDPKRSEKTWSHGQAVPVRVDKLDKSARCRITDRRTGLTPLSSSSACRIPPDNNNI